jgi:23S rRNA (pseudouridine1915-N3)-methyltransferase
VLAAEARCLDRHLAAGWLRVALDEGGTSHDSEAFAGLLDSAQAEGRAGVVFVLGSDLGLDREVAQRCDLRLSLSPMTLPHLLARLVLWEQLFRATHILGGGGYHRR